MLAGFAGSSGAWAQCSNDIIGGLGFALPLSNGGAVSAIISTINTANTAFLTTTSAFVSAPGGPRPDQQGGGAWGRVIGGSIENSTTGVTNAPFIPATQVCQTTVRADYAGFQVGHDISILNSGGTGANWHWGVTAGYLEANARDTTIGGTFRGNFQVPFAGVYTAFTKGNLALDGQARWDFYSNTLTDPANGLDGQTFNGRGFSLTGNASYNIPLRGNWFLEPSIGAVWSRVELDQLNVAGNGAASAGFGQIHDIESFLGRVSLSTGTTYAMGHVTWQPFFTASLFHEFKGDVATDLTAQFGGFGDATLTTSRVGTYAQFGVGSAIVLGNSGWLGYGRLDYRTGENIEGVSVNAGLRYQFSPVAGRGSIKDGPRYVDAAYSWTGPYIGGFVGSLFGVEDWVFLTGPPSRLNPDFGGYQVGGQAGYNVQLGRVVLGVEADYGYTNANGAVSCPNALFFTCEAELNRLGTLAGRIGVTWGRALFYAKGGWAYGEVAAGARLNTAPPGNGTQTTEWSNGWAVGGGMEFALTNHWSAKAEYLHYDLGKETYQVTTNPEFVSADTKGDTVRLGVNYHFHQTREPRPLK